MPWLPGQPCESDPVDVGSDSNLEPRYAVVAGGTEDIQALVDAQFAAWAAKDANAHAATYAPDARFLDPIGNVFEGREAIRADEATDRIIRERHVGAPPSGTLLT